MIVLRINWNLALGGRSRDQRRTRLWWQRQRWDIFRRFTLRSLVRQTEGDWQAWLRCDPALRDLTEPMARVMPDPRVRIVYDTPAAVAELRAAAPPRLIFGRLDSDDLLHPGALARWSREEPGLVQFGYGWAVNRVDGELYEWNHPSAPFIAQVGDAAMIAGHMPALGGNHGRVHQFARRLDDGRWYMVLLHGRNVCNTPRAPWRGRALTGNERAEVLATFGLDENDIVTSK